MPSIFELDGQIRATREMEIYRRFLCRLDPLVEESLRESMDSIDSEVRSLREEFDRDNYQEFLLDLQTEDEHFKVILMNSFFCSSFALFEYHLARLCQRVQSFSGSPFSVKDLGGASSTDRAKKYLETLGVNFPAQGYDWKEITTYREIRNRIMHEGGSLPESGDIVDYAEKKQIVPSPGERELELTRDFCEEALRNLERFFKQVNQACEQWRLTK